MKPLNFLLITLATLSLHTTSAQTAQEILENGIPVKAGRKLFFRYETNILKYAVEKEATDFTTLSDSSIFLVTKDGINIYLKPLNPLNYSYTTVNTVIIDKVDQDAETALGSIFSLLNQAANMQATAKTAADAARTAGGRHAAKPAEDICAGFDPLQQKVTDLEKILKADQKDEIAGIFKLLKSLSFQGEQATKDSLDLLEKRMAPVAQHFKDIEESLAQGRDAIDKQLSCGATNTFILKYIFTEIFDKFMKLEAEQKKRLDNLATIFKSVRAVQIAASSEKDGRKWSLTLDEVPSKAGKISVYTITIKNSGFELSDKNEIIASTTNDAISRTIRVRKFRRFIPEVVAGMAYTFIQYNKYGTATDSTGQLVVAAAGHDYVKNIKFNVMVNFDLFIPNSNVNPFWQIGIGTNADVPTLMTGFGLRGLLGSNRISISGGAAFAWVKDLTNLQLGSKVTGTADIDKDLTYQFSWTPKLYFGLQYNF